MTAKQNARNHLHDRTTVVRVGKDDFGALAHDIANSLCRIFDEPLKAPLQGYRRCIYGCYSNALLFQGEIAAPGAGASNRIW